MKITNLTDFKIDMEYHEERYATFIGTFKLRGRYQFHKQEALELLKLKKRYSHTQIQKIMDLLNENELAETYSLDEIEKDLFGKEIFEGELYEKPLTKYKRDIAKQIGILPKD